MALQLLLTQSLHAWGQIIESYYFSARKLTDSSPKTRIFHIFFEPFSIYMVPGGAKYREKGWAAPKTGSGPSANPFWDFELSGQARI